ncbi:unnamed protein product [Chrysoparadoxa australica]
MPHEGNLGSGVNLGFNYWICSENFGQILTDDVRDAVIALLTDGTPPNWLAQDTSRPKRIVLVVAQGLCMDSAEPALEDGLCPTLARFSSAPTRHSAAYGRGAWPQDVYPAASLLLWGNTPEIPISQLRGLDIKEVFARHVLTFEGQRENAKNRLSRNTLVLCRDVEATAATGAAEGEEIGEGSSGIVTVLENDERGTWTFRSCGKREGTGDGAYALELHWPKFETDVMLMDAWWQEGSSADAALKFVATKTEANVVNGKDGKPKQARKPLSVKLIRAVQQTSETAAAIAIANEHPDLPLRVAATTAQSPATAASADGGCATEELLTVSLTEVDPTRLELDVEEKRMLGIPMDASEEGKGWVSTAGGVQAAVRDAAQCSSSSSGSDEDEEGQMEDDEAGVVISAPFARPSQEQLWPSKGVSGDGEPLGFKLLGVDCEMVTTDNGLELARVSFVNCQGEVVYNRFVKPREKITDYNTEFSGVTASCLAGVTRQLADVQREILSFVDPSTVIVGHSIDSDLFALKMVHDRVIDTAALYPNPKGLPFKMGLRDLCWKLLRQRIQAGTGTMGHDSIQDASNAVQLALLKLRKDAGFGVPSAWSSRPHPQQESLFRQLRRGGKRRRRMAAAGAGAGAGASQSISCVAIGEYERRASLELPDKLWTQYNAGYRRESDLVWVAKYAAGEMNERESMPEMEEGESCNPVSITAHSKASLQDVVDQGVQELKRGEMGPSLLLVDVPCGGSPATKAKAKGHGKNSWAELDAAVGKLYKAAPEGTMLLAVCQGSLQNLSQLMQRKTKARWSRLSHENKNNIAGEKQEDPWGKQDSSDLRLAAEKAIRGVTFLGTK